MNLCNKTLPKGYLLVVLNKSTDSLYLNDLGVGIAQLINHSTYFDFTQHKYSHLTCSDATQGHLADVLCPGNKIQVDSISHVENAGSNNKFGGRHSAW